MNSGRRSRYPRGHRSTSTSWRTTSAACRHTSRARHRQPPAHQDAQDSGAGQAADAGRRRRHHLPEARRSRGFHRCRRRRRRAAHLQHRRRGQDRAADAALSKRLKRLAVVLDNEAVARGLSDAGKRHGVDIRFLIECDTGMRPQRRADPAGRARPRARSDEAAEHAVRRADDFPDRDARAALWLRGSAAAVQRRRHRGAGRFRRRHAGAERCSNFPMLTEHRAGTYIYNDVMQVAAGAATWDNCAMRVRATVVSRPTDKRAVIDAGTKVLTYDQYYAKGQIARIDSNFELLIY